MNGLDFDLRVLKPWERDPAFYTSIWTEQSDTPAHEGPTHHAIDRAVDLHVPADAAAEAKLTQELQSVPPLLAQARVNLVGNARDLWIAGIGNIKQQRGDLLALEEKTAEQRPRAQAGDSGRAAGDGEVRRPGSNSRRRRRPVRPASARRTTPGACATCTWCR